MAVSFGIALFVAGFALTISSLPSDSAAGSEGSSVGGEELTSSSAFQSDGILLLIGIVTSMVGVVTATAVPAAVFLRCARRDT